MGSGPATYLAWKRKVGGLILFAPYLSIHAAAKDLTGSFLAFFVKQRFKNEKLIKDVYCPTIIIHGEKDEVINCKHGRKLYKLSGANQKLLLTPKTMSHNKFRLKDEFVAPVKLFFEETEVFKTHWVPEKSSFDKIFRAARVDTDI